MPEADAPASCRSPRARRDAAASTWPPAPQAASPSPDERSHSNLQLRATGLVRDYPRRRVPPVDGPTPLLIPIAWEGKPHPPSGLGINNVVSYLSAAPSRQLATSWWRGRFWPVHGTLVAGVSALTMLAALLFWLLHEAITDDAYITLVYARNFAYHFHWGLLPGQLSNTATSPLNVLLLGAVTFVVRGPVVALGIVYVAHAAALAFGLAKLGESTGIGAHLAWVGAPLLLLNPLLASTLGLETTVGVTLLVFLAWSTVRANARWFGIVAGLVVLTRLDLATFVVVLFLSTPRLWKATHHAVGWAGAVALPWFAFSWVVLGSAIPDTLLIKQDQPWGSFTQGLIERIGLLYPWSVGGSLVVPGIGLLSLLAWPWWRGGPGLWRTRVIPALGLAGIAYFAAYASLNVPPYFWYYGPTIASLTVCAASLLALLSRVRYTRARVIALAMVTTLAMTPAGAAWVMRAREGMPFTRMLMHDNWARPGQYTAIGRELEKIVGNAGVLSPGEVGTLLFFCKCHLVDEFTDRGRVADLIAEAKRSSVLMRANYLLLDEATLVKDSVTYRLRKKPGLDPSPRGWNIYNPGAGWEHLTLTRVRPRNVATTAEDRALEDTAD